MHIMNFQSILYIWLAVLFAAYISGWVVHIMNRHARNLSGGLAQGQVEEERH